MIGNNKRAQFVTLKVVVEKKMEVEHRNQNLQSQHKHLQPQVLLEKQNPALKLRHPLQHPPQHPLHNQLQHKLKQLQVQPLSQLTVKPLVLQKEPGPRRKQKLLHKHQPP